MLVSAILAYQFGLWCDRRLGASDGIILESFPDLTAADLVNAWAYADAYPEEIEQTIKENDEERNSAVETASTQTKSACAD